MLPAGFEAVAIATGLTFPSGVTFDDQGRVHVVEAGYSYGERFEIPRLLRVDADGGVHEVARGDDPPWTGVTFHRGAFYVAEGGLKRGGRILRITPDGASSALVEDLPSIGDHHVDGPVVGPDGYLYFGLGTATNSGIVGPDNHEFGWLRRAPRFHDVPCLDVTLTGEDFESPDVLGASDRRVSTGAYSPFGESTEPSQVVRGRVPCSGAILKIPLEPATTSSSALAAHDDARSTRVRATADTCGVPPVLALTAEERAARVTPLVPELVAWGLRNPFGLAFSPHGRLFATDNGADHRGSRPIYGAADVLWEIRPGQWYGWPDFAEGRPIDQPRFGQRSDERTPRRLLATHPMTPPRPTAYLAVHSSSDGLDFSRNDEFGYSGQVFIAQFGDQAPAVGKVFAPVGFRIVRVDVATGVIADFAVNRADASGPASKLGLGGLERPVALRFDPSGRTLFVVDFGELVVDGHTLTPRPKTGVLWAIRRVATPAASRGGAR
ncbi:PQQ-dependent sugar dehydrogenase [Myxococcota bacterium]|nr:PQQ-dependent sugar dehydrogenase [Myxococcota bacterium]